MKIEEIKGVNEDSEEGDILLISSLDGVHLAAIILLCMTRFWIQERHFMLLLIRSGLPLMMHLARVEFVLEMTTHVILLELVCS